MQSCAPYALRWVILLVSYLFCLWGALGWAVGGFSDQFALCQAHPQPRKAVSANKLPKTAVAHIGMFNFFRQDLLAWPAYNSDVRLEIVRNITGLAVGEGLSFQRLEVSLTAGAGDWQAQGAAQA